MKRTVWVSVLLLFAGSSANAAVITFTTDTPTLLQGTFFAMGNGPGSQDFASASPAVFTDLPGESELYVYRSWVPLEPDNVAFGSGIDGSPDDPEVTFTQQGPATVNRPDLSGAYTNSVSGATVNFRLFNMVATGSGTGTWSGSFEFQKVSTMPDADSDGVPDVSDNCTLIANQTQLDSDSDGYGNICDPDVNNSGTVTTADFGLLRSVLGQPASFSATAAAADLNGSGTVTTADFGLLRARLGVAPGPSGLACAGTVPCP